MDVNNRAMRNVFLLNIFFFIIFSGCSSGKKSLEHGDYYNSVLQSVSRLRQNPNQKKAQQTLREGYPLAVRRLEDDARNRMASNAPFKWKSVLSSYKKINTMYEEINRSPGALRVISNPTSYYSEMEEARNNAAEESYRAGLDMLAENNRESAKQAYYHFRDADGFVRGYKDVLDKMAEAKFIATLKVVVKQIPVPGRYALSGGFFQDKIEEYVHSFNRNEFVRFFSTVEAENENLQQPDQIIYIAFDDFTVGETHVVEKTVEYSKDSVKVGEVVLDDGTKIPVYNTVKAKLTTFNKKVISRGVLNFQVIDAYNDAVLTTEKFPGEFVWYCEWGSYNGDERALTSKQLKITKLKEIPPPQPQDLFIEFTRPIYNQLTNKINSFYRNY